MYSSFYSLEFNNNNSDESEPDTYEENYESEDKIDSDIETALYGQIHHCENPVYEPVLNQGTENVEAENNSKGINCEGKLYNFNKEKAPSAVISDGSSECNQNNAKIPSSEIIISDDSDECNLVDTNSSDIKVVYERKKKTSSRNNIMNQKNEIQKKNISLTHGSNNEVTPLREINHKDRTLTKLQCSNDIVSYKGKKKKQLKNKVRKEISTSQTKQNSVKCSSKRKHSDSSESEDDVFKYPENSAESKDISINIKPSAVSLGFTKNDDLWYVSPKDVCPDKQQSRYYNREMRILCNNCLERGHVSRNCKMPKKLSVCYLCGRVGHEAAFCLEPACSKCLSLGHTRRQCRWKRTVEKCTTCNMINHFSEECPDRWRRYHMTTNYGPVIYGNSCKNSSIYCYNCAGKGHFGHECQKQRMDSSTFPTSPFISQYTGSANPFADYTSWKKNAKKRKQLKKLEKKMKIIRKSNKQFEKRLLADKIKDFLKESSPTPVKRKKKKPKKHLNKDIGTLLIQNTISRSNGQFENKSKLLADKAKEFLKGESSSAPVKQKMKPEKHLKKDTGILPSDEVQGTMCAVQKRKVKSFLTKVSKQTEKSKKKKKSKKLQQSDTKIDSIFDDKARTSNFNISTNASSVLRRFVPELEFSMTCMRLFSNKSVINS